MMKQLRIVQIMPRPKVLTAHYQHICTVCLSSWEGSGPHPLSAQSGNGQGTDRYTLALQLSRDIGENSRHCSVHRDWLLRTGRETVTPHALTTKKQRLTSLLQR